MLEIYFKSQFLQFLEMKSLHGERGLGLGKTCTTGVAPSTACWAISRILVQINDGLIRLAYGGTGELAVKSLEDAAVF